LRLPDPWRLSPLFPDEPATAVTVSVVLDTGELAWSQRARDVTPLVVVRQSPDARVYLGCLSDVEQNVLSWVEIWVQDLSRLEGELPRHVDSLNNAQLDRRWEALAKGMSSCRGAAMIWTGRERSNPAPTMVNLKTLRVETRQDEHGRPWSLCTDERALEEAGKGGFAKTLERHLWTRAGNDARGAKFLRAWSGGGGAEGAEEQA
jgi:hypothetical protein